MRRKPLALLAVSMILSACVGDGGPGSDSPRADAAPEARTESVELPVIHDFEVPGAAPQVELPPTDNPEIRVGEHTAAIFAVERPEVAADCLVAAQLRLYVNDSSANAPEQLAIYASHVFNAHDKKTGQRFGYTGTALDNRPRAMTSDPLSGWSSWDVTDIVRLWIGREPFPSRGKLPPKKGPIVFTLRDTEGAEPFGTAVIASAEAETAPHLVVTHKPDCSA